MKEDQSALACHTRVPQISSLYNFQEDGSDENNIYSISLLSPPTTLHSILHLSSPENVPRVSISLQNISQNSIPSNNGSTDGNNSTDLLRDEILGFEEMVIFAPMAKKHSNIYFTLELGKDDGTEFDDQDAYRDENRYSQFIHHLEDFSSFIHNYQNINYLNLSNCGISDDNVNVLSCLKECRLVRKLNLSRNELGCTSLKYLSEKLLIHEVMNCNLEELLLSHNLIGNLGLVALSKWISHNSTLRILSLNDNNFDFLGVKALCYGMILNNSITTIDVSNNNLKRCHILLSQLVQLCKQLQSISCKNTSIYDPSFDLNLKSSNILHLDIEGNDLGDEIVMKLVSSLMHHHSTIYSLNLKRNKISDQSMESLIKLLKHNSGISILDLRENLLSESSCEVLKQVSSGGATTLLVDTQCSNMVEQHNCPDMKNNSPPISDMEIRHETIHDDTPLNTEKEVVNVQSKSSAKVEQEVISVSLMNPFQDQQENSNIVIVSSTEEEDIVDAFLNSYSPQPKSETRGYQPSPPHIPSMESIEHDQSQLQITSNVKDEGRSPMNLSEFQTPRVKTLSLPISHSPHHRHVDLSQYSISKLRGQYVSSPPTLSSHNHSTFPEMMKNLTTFKTARHEY
ncbi:hypothetical protein C9374_008129 [Naegleria lovaniensis]|uniref:Uncharacterized protein n=1 Tax=Naegleria lovaniensis TaxID=51637 RepID=A0AA88KGB5_NAELO|nr:uncharacterized protein C9374_008129 [Naegleria lovaniensis]KAG2378490.1 hypothetical protein C9374_008129 [Naegleria lovaniensis]